jgi:hypothetical protein
MINNKIPNIFIKEINLFDGDESEFSVKVTTTISDTKDDNSWSNTKTSDYMKILVVISGNSTLNSNITESRINFDKDVLMAEYFNDETVKIFSMPIKSSRTISIPNGFVFLDSFEAKFPKNINEVTVFCSAYIEMSEIFQNANVDMSGPMRRYGSISSDSIIEFGSAALNTTVFVLPNGNQYFGPVHYHPDKGYMVGAKHISTNHSVLNPIEVANYKLKDFRKKHFMQVKPIGDKKTDDYSELSYSINKSGNSTGIFSINFKNLLLYKTKYGRFLRTLSDNAILQNLENIKIKNFEIVRKRIDVDETHIVGRSFSDLPGSPLRTVDDFEKTYISEIQTSHRDIRTFQFVDRTITKTSIGQYKYHLNLSFVDPTVQFITDIINDLRISTTQMRDYYLKIAKKKNYDFAVNKTKANFYNSEYEGFNFRDYDSPSWAAANEVYTRTVSYLYDLAEIEKNNLMASISTKIDPKNATIFSLKNFNEQLFSLSNDFQTLFNLSNNDIQSGSERKFLKNADSRNVLFLNHTFEQYYDPQNYIISYDYTELNSDSGAIILSKQMFESRIAREFDKFFLSKPSDKQAENIPKGYESLLNLDENLYSFLSPAFVLLGDKKINLKDIDLIDIKKVNEIFNKKNKINVNNIPERIKALSKNVSEEMSSSKIKKNKTRIKPSIIKLEEY